MQAKDIKDEQILSVIDRVRKERKMWTSGKDVEEALPEFPPKVILAKLRSMYKRKIIDGCPCGCRGDWVRI